MAGFDYGRMQKTATRLMERFKQGVVMITRVTPGVPDPATPWIPVEGTTETFDLAATVKGVSAEFVDGATILATDLEVTAADFGSVLAPADQVAIDGKAVIVVKTIRIPAAGTLVAWKFIVRG